MTEQESHIDKINRYFAIDETLFDEPRNVQIAFHKFALYLLGTVPRSKAFLTRTLNTLLLSRQFALESFGIKTWGSISEYYKSPEGQVWEAMFMAEIRTPPVEKYAIPDDAVRANHLEGNPEAIMQRIHKDIAENGKVSKEMCDLLSAHRNRGLG